MKQKTGIQAVFSREFRRIIGSKVCLWGIFFSTFATLGLFIWMMHSGLPVSIPVAVVDYDNTSTSRSLVRQLDAFPKTNIKFKSLSFRDARERMEKGEIFAILTIPKNFSADAIGGNRPKLVYYTNNAFLVSGSLLFQDLKTISTLASAAVGLQTGEARGYTERDLMPIIQPISVESHPLGNPWLNYSVYLSPTMAPCILQMIIFLFTVFCFGTEVKEGTGRQLLELSDNSILKAVSGKLLPYTLLYIVIALLYMAVLFYYAEFPLKNGFLPMFLNYLCLIIASQGVGLLFISAFVNFRFAVSIASLIGSVSLSLEGVSFSVLSMDPTLHAVSYLLPIRHFFLVYVDQALNGIPAGYSMYHYAAMLAFSIPALFLLGRLKKFLLLNVYEP